MVKYLSKSEATVHKCSMKKLLWRISQYSKEKTYARVSILIKFRVYSLKKDLWHDCYAYYP